MEIVTFDELPTELESKRLAQRALARCGYADNNNNQAPVPSFGEERISWPGTLPVLPDNSYCLIFLIFYRRRSIWRCSILGAGEGIRIHAIP